MPWVEVVVERVDVVDDDFDNVAGLDDVWVYVAVDEGVGHVFRGDGHGGVEGRHFLREVG